MAQESKSMLEATKQFFSEVWQELHKVTWSTREQLIQSTKVVILGAFITAAYLGAVDFLFSAILTWFLDLKL